MSFFEQYRMNIPIFAPSLEFLTRLHMEHNLVYDKTLNNKAHQNSSSLPRHPAYNISSSILRVNSSGDSNGSTGISIITSRFFDPNDETNVHAVRHWLALADYYTFPHVVLFNSTKHLVDLLHSMTLNFTGVDYTGSNNRRIDLKTISAAMRVENRAQLKRLLRYWRKRLFDIAQHSLNAHFLI